jgi:hypothetical protein
MTVKNVPRCGTKNGESGERTTEDDVFLSGVRGERLDAGAISNLRIRDFGYGEGER